MRFLVLVLLFGLAAAAGGTAHAGDSGAAGVTVWRGSPGDWQHGKPDEDLPAWIRQSRDRLAAAGTSAIPRDIQKRFRHAFPAGLFDWARFGISSDERIWRQAARRGYGTALVLVFDDVILFRTPDSARNHTAWYDGLAQAQEFRRFGPDKVLARQGRGYARHLEAPRTAQPYPLPDWQVRDGRYGPSPGANGAVTVPGIIIVKPVNPYRAN